MAVSCFSKQSILDAWQGSEYASSSEYSRVLNSSWFWIYTWLYLQYISECARVLDTPEFWICFWIWICHDCQYTRVMNMPGLYIVQNIPQQFWKCVNMPDYVWICLNMPEYPEICVNVAKSAWLAFVLHVPISPFILQSLFYK